MFGGPGFLSGALLFKRNFLGWCFCGFAGDFRKKRGAGCGFWCGKGGHVVVKVRVVSPFVNVIASLVLVIKTEGSRCLG